MTLAIRRASARDVPVILAMVKALADYEREPDAVAATEEMLEQALFGPAPVAHALIGEADGATAGFLLYFFNFSTWTGRPGLYVEDLFVAPEARGRGLGKKLLAAAAKLAVERGCGRWNGRCSTGTRPRSASTAASARGRWTNGRCSVSTAMP